MKPLNQVSRVLSLVVAMLIVQGNAVADLVLTDLNMGGTDTGFSGGWAGSANRMLVQTNDLISANYSITQSGTVENVYGGNNTHPDRMDSRDLAAAMSNEVWFTILTHAPTGGGFAGISFHSDTVAQTAAAYSHNLSDLRIVMSTNELWVDWEGAALGASWTSDATVGGFSSGTHLLLGKLNIVAGNDTLQVWVDPNLTAVSGPGDLPAATYTQASIDFADKIVRIGLPIYTPSDTVDMIMLSDTATAFYDVAGEGAVPPPKGTVLVIR